jgi:hypothetical protein
VDDFRDFLLPPSEARMRELAAAGPVVTLVHPSDRWLGRDVPDGCGVYALVVTAERVTSLQLPTGPEEVTEVAARLRAAISNINAHGQTRPGPCEVIAAGDELRQILAWTWHTVVQPVLAVAGIATFSPGRAAGADGIAGPDEPSRMWWIPTGPFNALPLHAAECAGCGQIGCGTALDSVVSSYVPGFGALAHARAMARVRITRDPSVLTGVLLAVGESVPELPTTTVTELTGAAASHDAVLDGLANASLVHFGCHATSDPAEPSGSVLHLPGGEPLPVLEICRTQTAEARLAFLAACGTSQTSERLPDESVHLTSAFLLAGFPQTVGTLWEIDAADAAEVTGDFYRTIATREGVPDGTLPAARALREVVRKLQREQPVRVHAWAAYVHAGA